MFENEDFLDNKVRGISVTCVGLLPFFVRPRRRSIVVDTENSKTSKKKETWNAVYVVDLLSVLIL